ncbi:LEA domain protein [Aspergillus clavatus NRRL 1]|uniref:LEA domain protein n=1 Tax=Aspergillus clavatus (strain ATCC 1007 / CBS 513.65 / DSM 816 / NCTC 3887 / NRRL 1 / QM 1276 / 107) TaxID=344612 RepID=A1CKQ2_ASPCL|nr:LEA domain protein [Aspergillus clavatus NRRL 1]EAW09726.1 LEA domain protein [Aspergillus clavatus NRRL 1]
MSALARFAPLTARAAAVRTVPAVTVGARFLSSTPKCEKGPVETTKDTLKKADRIVSDYAVKGINKGEEATNKLKETVGSSTAEAEGKAKGTVEELKGDAAEVAGKSKGKAEEALGSAKGTAKEVYGEAKGKAKEMGNM